MMKKPNVSIFMGCVGKDEYSKILEAKARSDGVDVRYQYTDKESTGIFSTSNAEVDVTARFIFLFRNLCCAVDWQWE